MTSRIRWVQYNEKVIGENHPTIDDVDNRPLKDIILFSSGDPSSDDFPGFLVRFVGGLTDPNGSQVGNIGNSYLSLVDGGMWLKIADGNGTNTGWVRPAASTIVVTGTTYVPKTFPVFDPDKPPTSPNAKNDEFDDTTGNSGPVNGLNAKWTWINQGTATATFERNMIKLSLASHAGDDIKALSQPLPATPYKVVCKVSIQGDLVDTRYAGVGIRRSATGAFFGPGIGLRSDGVFDGAWVWASNTGGRTDRFVSAMRSLGPYWLWIEIEDDGTTLTFRLSRNGVHFNKAWSETRAAFVGTPDQITLWSNNNSTIAHTVYFEFFRVHLTSESIGALRNVVEV